MSFSIFKKPFFLLVLSCLTIACKSKNEVNKNSSASAQKDIVEDAIFKVLDSKVITTNSVFKDVILLEDFTARDYKRLEPIILEKSIPQLQMAVYTRKVTYQEITSFYLYRLKKYDRNNKKSLNSVISLNKLALEDAYSYDIRMEEIIIQEEIFNPNTLMGLPILLKDNINTDFLPTTAGAIVLKDNNTPANARLVDNLISSGAIILGKVNLSEWAYYFCGDCPSGYSAIGGQTLNPYGRKAIDTGGSSSGSGVAVAANFAVAAVGTETAGSIISPASQNSVVGLKPTKGRISGMGVIPISNYLDTAGPMTKNVIDNAILLRAMMPDKTDILSDDFIKSLETSSIKGYTYGVFPAYLENPLYKDAVDTMRSLGATIVELEPKRPDLTGFLNLLNNNMKQDLYFYFMGNAANKYQGWSIENVMEFNKKDSLLNMPYGQRLFDGIIAEKEYNEEEIYDLAQGLTASGQEFFDYYIKTHNLDGFLSINNYNAAEAAVAFYPALTVPMGYDDNGVPFGLTFIAPSEEEELLYQWAAAYEKATLKRKMPQGYSLN